MDGNSVNRDSFAGGCWDDLLGSTHPTNLFNTGAALSLDSGTVNITTASGDNHDGVV
jgi:hypothetical protein